MSNMQIEIEKQISFFTDLRLEMKEQEKNAESELQSELLRYYHMGKISALNDIISALLALKRNCTE